MTDEDEDIFGDIFKEDDTPEIDLTEGEPEKAEKPEPEPEAVDVKAEPEQTDTKDPDPEGEGEETIVAETTSDAEEKPESHHVPLGKYLSEREAKQDLKAQLERETAQRENLERQLAQHTAQPTPAQPAPDIFEDPEGAQNHILEQARQIALNERVGTSKLLASEKYGAETCDQALAEAKRQGIAPQFLQKEHPYGDLVQWYQGQQVVTETGGDLEAYKAKLRDEIKAEMQAEIDKKTGNVAADVDIPPTMAGTSSASKNAGERVLSDEEGFAQVFSQ